MFAKKDIKEIIKKAIPEQVVMFRLNKRYSGSILLTFDDGPDRKITPHVLDILEKHDASAIFFVVGRKVKMWPEIVTQIIAKGHLIGNHSYDHPEKNYSKLSFFIHDIKKCQKVLCETTNNTVCLYRPPRGVITPIELMITKWLKLSTVLWSNEGGEWGRFKDHSEEKIAGHIINSIKGRDIVLLHDNNPKVPNILKRVLESPIMQQIAVIDAKRIKGIYNSP